MADADFGYVRNLMADVFRRQSTKQGKKGVLFLCFARKDTISPTCLFLSKI